MIPVAQIRDPEVAEMALDAAAFLSAHQWCRSVRKAELGWALAGVLGVFRITIDPASPEVHGNLWVVIGDLPPAYLVADDTPTWRDALAGYVMEMTRWIDAVRAGDALDDVIPVDAEPTVAHADLLESRLRFIREEILDVPAEFLEGDV